MIGNDEEKKTSELTTKEKEKMEDILENGEITNIEEHKDIDAIVERIVSGEVISVEFAERIKLLSDKKLKKIIRKLQLNFGKSISIKEISPNEVELKIGDQSIVLTGDQAEKVVNNGFANEEYVNVTEICKKETWEKRETHKKIALKGLVAATVLVIIIPFMVKGCQKQEKIDVPQPEPEPIVVEVEDSTEYPIYEDLDTSEYSDLFALLKSLNWVPGTTQQYQWSSNEDTYLLGIDNPYTAEVINKQMQVNQKLIEDIESFAEKYENRKLSGTEKDKFLMEAMDLLDRVETMIQGSYESTEYAEDMNKQRIEKGIILSGDLETESKTRMNIFKTLREDLNTLNVIRIELSEQFIAQSGMGGKII